MPIRTHLVLTIAGEFLGFIAGAILCIWIFMAQPGPIHLIVMALIALPIIAIFVMLPRTLFRRLIPARCPAPGCAGGAYATGSHPITYICRRCGHIHETSVSEGGPHDRNPTGNIP